MLVRYEAPPAASRRSHGSLADYLRRGGRVNPIPFGAGPRDEERAGLLSEESESIKLIRMSERSQRLTRWAVLLTLVIASTVFGLLIWLLSQANSTVASFRAAMEPHADSVVNATVDMLHDMGGTMYNMKEITHMTNALAQSSLGPDGAAGHALNDTASIAHALAVFMKHPTLQLSLGGNQDEKRA